MRKKFSVALVALMGLTLFACGKKTDTKPTDTKPTQTDTSEIVVKKYTVTVVNSIQGAGTISGIGEIEEGKSTTIKAVANDGYTFLGFYDGETCVSENAEYTITVSKNVNLTARWTAKTYNLTVKTFSNVDPANIVEFTDDSLGTVTYADEHDGVYSTGEAITLTATPATGYQFNGWYLEDVQEGDHLLSPDATYDFHMLPQTTTIKAIFGTKKCTYEIVSNIDGAMPITETGFYDGTEYWYLDEVESITVDYGTTVTIFSENYSGYSFQGFYVYREDGDYSTSTLLPTEFEFDAEDSCKYVAWFSPNDYDFNINNIYGGTVTFVEGEETFNNDVTVSMEFNSTITLKAEPEEGFTFGGWYDDEDFETLLSDSAEYTYTQTLAGTANIWVKFIADKVKVNFIIPEEMSGMGTVTESGYFDYDTEITFTATPTKGYVFLGWYVSYTDPDTGETEEIKVSAEGENTMTYNIITLDEQTFIAKFELGSYKGCGHINIEDLDDQYYDDLYAYTDKKFDFGSEVTFVAVEIPGYIFKGWYLGQFAGKEFAEIDETKLLSENATYTFNWNYAEEDLLDAGTASARVCFTAVYDRQLIKLNYNTNGGDDTSVEFVKVKFGLYTTLEVPTRYGYAFQYWDYADENGVRHQLTNANGEMLEPLALLQETTIRAKWLDGKVIASFNTDGGTTIDDQEVTFNHTITRPDDPEKDGYEFVGWFDNNGIAWSFSQAIVQNTTLYAHWNILQYTIELVSQDGSVVTVNSSKIDGTYDFDTVLNIEANVAEGYTFAGWYDGTTLVSENEIYAYHLPSHDVTLTAKFTVNQYNVTVQIRSYWYWVNISGMSVTGAGTYDYNDKVTLTSTFGSGYYIYYYYTNITGSWTYLKDSSNNYIRTNPITLDVTARNFTVYIYIASYAQTVRLSNSVNVGSEGTNPYFTVDGTGTTHYNNTGVQVDRITTIHASEIDGYNFLGWYDKSTGLLVTEELEYQFDMPNKQLTYEARYEEKDYELNLYQEVNDHDDDTEDTSLISSENIIYKESTIISAEVKEGYTFLGWYDGTTLVSNAYNYTYTMPKTNKTLVAKYEIDTYGVFVDYGISNTDYNLIPGTFNFNDDEYYEYDYNTEITLTATAYDGWTFKGFYVTDDFDSNFDRTQLSSYTLISGNTFTIPAYSVCIYPVFEAKQYVIIYSENGGTVSADSAKILMGNKLTITGNDLEIPTRSGMDFQGWKYTDTETGDSWYVTADDGKLINYYDFAKGITIKAMWGDHLWAVTMETGYNASTYDANDTKTYVVRVANNDLLTQQSDPVRKGYTFLGWFNQEEGGTEWNYSTPITSDTTIYAHWSVNTYYVRFDMISDGIASYTYTVVDTSTSGTVSKRYRNGTTGPETDILITIEYGQTIEFRPTFNLGRHFNQWIVYSMDSQHTGGTTYFNSWIEDWDLAYKYDRDLWIRLNFSTDDEMSYYNFSSTTTTCDITSLTTSGKSATELYVPDYVTSIAELAFAGNTSLVSVSLPFLGTSLNAVNSKKPFVVIFGTTGGSGYETNNGKYLNDSGVESSLTTRYIPTRLRNITIRNEQVIGAYAFYDLRLVNSVTINEGITRIGTLAFYGVAAQNLTLPSTLVTIDTQAFRWMPSLQSLVVPQSVTSIGKAAFKNCYGLKSLTIPFVGQKNEGSLGEAGLFGWIFGDSTGSATSNIYVVSQDYTIVEDGETKVKTVEYALPNNLASVTVNYASSTVNLPYGAFMNCSKLTNVILNKQGTGSITLQNYLFYKCTNLESISGSVIDRAMYVNPYAFYQCTSLTSFSCLGYKIDQYAFYGCTKLESYTQTSTSSFLYFEEFAFCGCTSLSELNIGGTGRLCIYEQTFANCTSLTSFDYPTRSFAGSFTKAFSGCTSLESFSGQFAGNVGQYQFLGCTALKSVSIVWHSSASTKAINDGAFEGCTKLATVTIDSTTKSIGAKIFKDCNSLTTITVPYLGKDLNAGESTLTSYSYNYTLGYFFGSSTSVSNMSSTGTSVADPEVNSNFPSGYKQTITSTYYPISLSKINITAATNIAAYAVANIRNCYFDVEISSTTNYKIGKCAFFNTGIQHLSLGSGLKSIGDCAFYDGYLVDEIVLPSGLTSIGNYAFGAQTFTENDIEIVIPDSVTTIGTKVFYDPYTTYNYITKITLGSGITTVAANAFYGVSDSVELYFNGTLNEFGTKRATWPAGWNYVSSSIQIFSCVCSNGTATWQ